MMSNIEVKAPVLYNRAMVAQKRIYPVSAEVTLALKPLSTGRLVVQKSDGLQMHDWVELFTPHGSAGIYRVSELNDTVNNNEISVTLEHGICTLRDAVADITPTPNLYTAVDVRSTQTPVTFTGTEAAVTAACIAYQEAHPAYTPQWAITVDDSNTYFAGTPTAVLAQILGYQTIQINGVDLWAVGTVEPTANVKIQVDHDLCLDLLDELMENLPDYMLEFDQSSLPWTVSIKHRPTQVSAEGRLSRNLARAEINYDDGELFTRIYMDDLPNGHLDADTIGTYGIIGTFLSAGDKLSAAEKLAICQQYLNKHKNPSVSISLDAVELAQLTGDDLDALNIGRLYRLALPDYGITLNEHIISLFYAAVYDRPAFVTVTLANDTTSLVSRLSEMQKRMGGGGGKNPVEEEQGRERIRYDLQVNYDKKHFSILATEEEWSDAWQSYFLTNKTYFNQTARKFYLLATEQEYADIEAGQTTLVEKWTSELDLTAQKLNLVFNDTQYRDLKEIIEDAGQQYMDATMYSLLFTHQDLLDIINSRKTMFKMTQDQIALKVEKGGVATQLAIEVGNVNITGGNLTVDGYVTASAFNAEQARFDNLVSGMTTATALKASLIQATNTFNVGGTIFRGTPISIGSVVSYTGLTSANASINLDHSHAITMTESGGVVTATLGAARTTSSSDRIANFNIADTAYFRNAVSAAQTTGWTNAANAVRFPNSGTKESMIIYYPDLNGTTSQKGYYLTQGGWSNGKKTISLRQNSTVGTIVAQLPVNMPTSATWNVYSYAGTTLGETVYASCTVGGKKYEVTTVI